MFLSTAPIIRSFWKETTAPPQFGDASPPSRVMALTYVRKLALDTSWFLSSTSCVKIFSEQGGATAALRNGKRKPVVFRTAAAATGKT
ncbi:unnamed protein product [Gadus morhua 'NCC']